MRRRILVSLAPVVALALSAAAPATKPGDELLVPRIRLHFDSVLAELEARDVSALSASQREARARAVATVRRYKDRGVFPHNYDFPGELVPYFVDRKTGTLCAVANLLAFTGRRDIVDRVARMDNNVWVPELAGDAEFQGWLDANGLALAEAARIQVPYMNQPNQQAAFGNAQRYTTGAAMTTLTVGAVTVGNLFWNRSGGGRTGNVVGVAAGVAGMALGASSVFNDTQGMQSGFVNIGVGTLSAVISTRAILNRPTAMARQRALRQQRGTEVNVSPILPTPENGAGLSLSFRF
jgi:hypothetical protein